MAQLENETIRLRALEPEDLELLYRQVQLLVRSTCMILSLITGVPELVS